MRPSAVVTSLLERALGNALSVLPGRFPFRARTRPFDEIR